MLRGALIGSGNAALKGHLPAFLEDPWLRQKVQIVSAADPCAKSRAGLHERMDSVELYGHVDELLERCDVDFVDICAPPDSRLGIIRRVVERGLHILCEKPLANHWDQGLQILQVLDGCPVVFMPCHQYRFAPQWQTVGRLIEEEAIGRVHLAQFEVLRPHCDPGSIHWRPNWRCDPAVAGGGVLFDIGTHYFYLIFTLFGLPERVTARTGRLVHRDYHVEDTALVILEYEERLVQINLTWAAENRESRARLMGTKGQINVSGDGVWLQQGAGRHEWRFDGAASKAVYPQWYGALFREFVGHVESRNYNREFLQDALNALRCVEACYRSASTGQSWSLSQLEL